MNKVAVLSLKKDPRMVYIFSEHNGKYIGCIHHWSLDSISIHYFDKRVWDVIYI